MHTSDIPQPEMVAPTEIDTAPGPETEGALELLRWAEPDAVEQRIISIYRELSPKGRRFPANVFQTLDRITAEVAEGIASWDDYGPGVDGVPSAAFFERLEREHPEGRDYIQSWRAKKEGTGNV